MKVSEKYTRLAPQFSERSYADPETYMRRRAEMVLWWGVPLGAGDWILELACGDGYLGTLLAREGLRYIGVDIAPGMVRTAVRRTQICGVKARFVVGDMDEPCLDSKFDAIICFARTFFAYSRDPLYLLQWMREHVRKKVLVDWNRYAPLSLEEAIRLMHMAGFAAVEVRPFLVPMSRRVPGFALRALSILNGLPVAQVFVQVRFAAVLKGELERR